MARFDTSGLDDLIKDIGNLDLTDEETDEVLLAGAEEVKKAWCVQATAHGLKDTGDMIESIGYAKKPKSVGGVKQIDIYPQGKDRKGVRNAEKAFINNYGTSRIKATHFVDDADEMAGDLVQQAMENKYNKLLDKKG